MKTSCCWGAADDYDVDKAQKQLMYNTLASVLEDGIAEIKPKLLGLGWMFLWAL